MRLNQATDYAFRIVLFLTRQQPDKITDARRIAEAEQIPIRFLLKTIRFLVQAGIVKSYRGIKGGYQLAKHPAEITLKDVVEAVEGPVIVNKCLMDAKDCNKDATDWCPIHLALANVQRVTNEELARYDFATLIKSHADGKT